MKTMDNYPWAVNKEKLARAIKALQDEGAKVTDEAVREKYVGYAGLVIDQVEAEPKAKKEAKKEKEDKE